MSNENTCLPDAVSASVPPPATPARPSAPATIEVDLEPSVLAIVQEAARNVSWQKVGVGAAIGIGSAAVAAALLYANRGRKA